MLDKTTEVKLVLKGNQTLRSGLLIVCHSCKLFPMSPRSYLWNVQQNWHITCS
uniref:Uncharacterized protein n=1 Tax=Arundo donax TaxID=35708 RepID=A0A0A9E4G2_ARUDO